MKSFIYTHHQIYS